MRRARGSEGPWECCECALGRARDEAAALLGKGVIASEAPRYAAAVTLELQRFGPSRFPSRHELTDGFEPPDDRAITVGDLVGLAGPVGGSPELSSLERPPAPDHCAAAAEARQMTASVRPESHASDLAELQAATKRLALELEQVAKRVDELEIERAKW